MTTDDPWLNKLVGNGSFIRQNENPVLTYKNECKPVLGIKFESLQQLKNMDANYGVQNGYQLWHWLVYASAFIKVKVRRGDQSFSVNLHTMKCVWDMWQLSGIPCVHVMTGYMHMKMNLDLGINECRGGSSDGSSSIVSSRGGVRKRGRGSSKKGNSISRNGFIQGLRDESDEMAHDKEDVVVGTDLPTQESTLAENLKHTGSKKSKPAPDPNQMRFFHKNRGKSERIFNQKMKNFKFDEHGTRSTLEKAFDVE
ncbi:hypothetical protein Tco_0908719 [Tanacetum coccineum]|uniref:Zinc finger PMZ-type domain-containing protein n=1 Tax=Tanacetum coccineum TaxID=301880 RepID=A0ABQ5CP11_9ASTR